MVAWGASPPVDAWGPRRSRLATVPRWLWARLRPRPAPGAATAAGWAVGTVAVTLVLLDGLSWAREGASLPGHALAGTLVAVALLLVATGWRRLPGRAGATVTRGWPTALSVALPLVAGPFPALVAVAATTAFAVAVDRSPEAVARRLRDLAGVATSGAALVAVGAGGPPTQPLLTAPQAAAFGVSVLVIVVVLATHVALGLASGGTGGPPAALAGRAGTIALPLAGAVLLGPSLAVLLTSGAWLVVPTLLVVGAVGLLADNARAGALGVLDPLTGLPGRRGLQDAAQAAVERAVAGGPPVALLVVDLDRFQEVNDGHGHRTGDRVMRVVAQRLRRATRPEDVVARLGGDEFGVLVPGVGDVEALVDLARRLRVSLGERIEGGEEVFGPGASVGIALAPRHAATASQLMARADLAVHGAKEAASGIRVHDGRRDTSSAERLTVVAAVRSALDGDAVQLAYQPKVALGADGSAGDRLAGVEALVRFTDPRHPGVTPGRAVPVVEGTGLMGRLTTAVLDRALGQVGRWLAAGDRVPVAVNVSLRDLEGADFADLASAALVRAGVPGSLLTLEITERVLTGDLSAVVATMERLQRIGVRLSLDDFGTGWSSLLLLRRLPVAEVKLDRSFVAGIARDDADAAVVESVAALTRRLGLTLVAEGVEQPEQLARLRRAGCDVVQGFLLAEPLPPEQVVPWSGGLGRGRVRALS
ncbi:MAG: putative bifunctional diguanylate cyclase/phosphodiesterase [Kineosporiaceae bacterium]